MNGARTCQGCKATSIQFSIKCSVTSCFLTFDNGLSRVCGISSDAYTRGHAKRAPLTEVTLFFADLSSLTTVSCCDGDGVVTRHVWKVCVFAGAECLGVKTPLRSFVRIRNMLTRTLQRTDTLR